MFLKECGFYIWNKGVVGLMGTYLWALVVYHAGIGASINGKPRNTDGMGTAVRHPHPFFKRPLNEKVTPDAKTVPLF